MANSSVHLSEQTLKRLDREAKRMRVSRNRVIVNACERYLAEAEAEGGWPPGFFDALPDAERRQLESARSEMGELIRVSRKSRDRSPF